MVVKIIKIIIITKNFYFLLRDAAISTHCQRAITMLSEKTLLLNRAENDDSVISLLDLGIDNFELHRTMLHMHALENQVYNIDLSDIIAFEEVVIIIFIFNILFSISYYRVYI